MPDDSNTSTVTIRRRDGTTYTQTTVRGEGGTKKYNTEGGRTYLVNQTTSGGSIRYEKPAGLNNQATSMGSESIAGTGGRVASPTPSTVVEKVPVYAQLNPDGTISQDIYVKEGDEFKKSESTFINEKGETVVQTAQLPTRVKQRIEAGSPTAITDEALNKPVQKVGGATIQTGTVSSTRGRDLPPIQRGAGNALDTFFLSSLKAGNTLLKSGAAVATTANPLLSGAQRATGYNFAGFDNLTLRSPLTDRQFTVNTPIRANVANKPIRSVLEFAANKPAETAGIAAGAIYTAPYAVNAVTGTAAFKTAASGLAAVEGFKIGSISVGAGAVGLVKIGAVGLGVTEASKTVIPIFDPKLQQSLLSTNVKQSDIDKARAQARQAELQKINSGSGFGLPFGLGKVTLAGAANEINPLLAGSKSTYARTLRTELINKGYNPTEVAEGVRIGLKQREYNAYAEASGVLATNVASELVGSKLIANAGIKAQQNTFLKNFAKIGGNIGIAGIGEGATIRGIQTRTRAEKTSAGELAIYGGAGFLTAGILGGAIGALQIKPAVAAQTGTVIKGAGRNQFLKNALLGVAYTTDPYEFAGDKIAGGYAKAATRVFGRKPYTPIVSIAPTTVPTTTTASDRTGSGGGRTTSFLPTFNVAVNTNIQNTVNVPTQTKTNANTPANTFADVYSFVSSSTNVDVNTNILSNTNTPTNVNTAVNVPAAVNIPALTTAVTVAVPNARLPPILPLAFPTSAGTGGRGGRSRRRYVNELAVGGALLQDLTGSNLSFSGTQALLRTPRKKKTGKSKGGRKRK